MPYRRKLPHPPRPANPSLFEPSLTAGIRALVALLGARRALSSPVLRTRLELTGLTWGEISPYLARIRTVEGWTNVFARAADEGEAAGDDRRASALAFLAQLILSPCHPRNLPLQEQMRRCHQRDRSQNPDITFERRSLQNGALFAYRETPRTTLPSQPTVLLLPPLASTKEELTVLAAPLLACGFPVVRLDLPGQGESPPPLPLDAERLLKAALDEMGIRRVITGGISLGAHFALRLAGAAPRLVRGVFGVSPPAIVTPAQWAKQPEVIYQYLDRYFATATRAETLRLGLAMTLDDVVSEIAYPILLFHAARDRICLPDAADRYRAVLANVPLTDSVLPDTHACPGHLKSLIAPAIAEWCEKVAGPHPLR